MSWSSRRIWHCYHNVEFMLAASVVSAIFRMSQSHKFNIEPDLTDHRTFWVFDLKMWIASLDPPGRCFEFRGSRATVKQFEAVSAQFFEKQSKAIKFVDFSKCGTRLRPAR